LSSLDEQGDPAPTLVMFVGEATDTDTGVVNAFVALVHSNYTSQKKKKKEYMTNELAVFGLYITILLRPLQCERRLLANCPIDHNIKP